MAVPMVDLPARHARVAGAVEAAVTATLRSGAYIGGPALAAFLTELAARHRVRHAVGAGSGTAALRMLLQAAGVGPGDEVLVPAVSFFATAEAVVQVGARPVVVDVLPATGLIDPEAARRALGPRVRAAVPVWLFGNRPPPLALGPGVRVLDDAAQAVGRDLSGRSAALSFYPTKVVGAAGDGGALLTDDPELAARATRLGSHGSAQAHDHHAIGGHLGDNNRLDALQAAVLGPHLADLGRRVARRRAIAARYATLRCGAVPHDPESPVSVYCIRVLDRARLVAHLTRAGVASAVYYPRPLHQQPALTGRVRLTDCPAAEAFCAQALALPCHGELSDAQVARVLDAARVAA